MSWPEALVLVSVMLCPAVFLLIATVLLRGEA